MRILLVLPDGNIHKVSIGRFGRSMREAPLTMTTLAALTPKDMHVEFKLVDESINQKVPYDEKWDLVAISVLTGTSTGAYEIARRFRKLGTKVVLGGVHVTIRPDEAKQHADAIVIGAAERAWPALLRDLSNGELKQLYDGEVETTDERVLGLPVPRREIQRSLGYNIPNTVMATRGCRHACDFCSVPTYITGYSKRPIGEVIDDIRSAKRGLLAISDVSLVDDVEYAKELFAAMIPLKRKWGGLATIHVAQDPELLDLLQKSGCIYLLIGFESILQGSLKEIHKGFNKAKQYKESMQALHDHGISIQGCFMFGFDSDDHSVFEATVSQVNELKIDIPRYSILTPYPNTPLFIRLLEEGRILSVNWDDYDTMHAVFNPKQMTAQELYDGFKWAYKETFKIRQIAGRTRWASMTGLVNFVGNLTYRRFVKRLYKDPRYSLPYTPNCPPEPAEAAVLATR